MFAWSPSNTGFPEASFKVSVATAALPCEYVVLSSDRATVDTAPPSVYGSAAVSAHRAGKCSVTAGQYRTGPASSSGGYATRSSYPDATTRVGA